MMARTTVALSIAVLALGLETACTRSASQNANAADKESAPQELMRRAEASAAVGDMTRAEQYYVAALKAGANEKAVVQRLLVVCTAEHRYPVAADYAAGYLRRHPSDMDVAFAAAAIHAAVGELDRARALLERVVRSKPDWADAHYALATVLREEGGDLRSADEHDLYYLRLAPNGALAEVARARLRRAVP